MAVSQVWQSSFCEDIYFSSSISDRTLIHSWLETVAEKHIRVSGLNLLFEAPARDYYVLATFDWFVHDLNL